jgi:hypothetical protein
MRYTAWVATGPDQLQGCVLTDVTDAGGRINIEDSTTVPDQFMLFLASNGSARRKCRVIWRNPNQVGVSFEGRRLDGEEATLVPKPDADAHGQPEPSTVTLLRRSPPSRPSPLDASGRDVPATRNNH